PRRDGVCGAAHHGTPLLAGEMDVDENDQVERASRRRIAAEIGLGPVDLDPARVRQTPCFLQADAGEVDSGATPPPFRKPDRVATFAGAEVERSPGREIRYLLYLKTVRLSAPDQFGIRVALIPCLTIHDGSVCAATPCRRAIRGGARAPDCRSPGWRGRRWPGVRSKNKTPNPRYRT